MLLLSALSLGFLSSFHCVGMCGPIALAIPVRRTSRLITYFDLLSYHIARASAYALLGAFFGAIGQGFALAGLQSWLSIGVGIALLLILATGMIAETRFAPKLLYKAVGRLKSKMSELFRKKGWASLLTLGFLNGFLPCGMVYVALTASIVTGNAIYGAFFMFLFGMGTLPAMMTLTLIREKLSIGFRDKMRKTVPVFVGMLAVLMILRGLNLGIPYISPKIVVENNHCVHSCCAKK